MSGFQKISDDTVVMDGKYYKCEIGPYVNGCAGCEIWGGNSCSKDSEFQKFCLSKITEVDNVYIAWKQSETFQPSKKQLPKQSELEIEILQQIL